MARQRALVPSMEGKTVVITGANTGIGRVTAERLGAAGARMVLAGRSAERTAPVLEALRAAGADASFVALDLGSLASVRDAVVDVLGQVDRCDVLINNAGLAGVRGLTADGFEMHLGVNHVGHYLWTRLLLDGGVLRDGARIVNVASRAHTRVPTLDLDNARRPARSRLTFREYCNSKLANVLFSNELARRLDGSGITSTSLHPGVVATDIWRRIPGPVSALVKRWFMITEEEGAQTTLHCAAATACEGASGTYYDDCAEKQASAAGRDTELAATLWQRSADWVGLPDAL